MQLDLPTLAVVAVFVTVVLAALLAMGWLQNRAEKALLVWSATYLSVAAGIGLVVSHGTIPRVIAIDVGNALVLLGFGLAWAGARTFDGRPVHWPSLFIAPAVWVIACRVPAIYDDVNHRMILGSALLAVISPLTAWELWRGRAEPLISRWPLIVLFGSYSLASIGRIVLTLLFPISPSIPLFLSVWFPALAFGSIVYAIAIAFLMLALTKDRAELWHKNAALIDPLTGVANRRAFLDQAARRLQRLAHEPQPVAVLLFDIDEFKALNDRFGHSVGDQFLEVFADTAANGLRPTDLIARLGGEEFAALLMNAEEQHAMAVAERIREAFRHAAVLVDDVTVRATVSVGVAAMATPPADVNVLLIMADRALYRAKALGRNRVESGAAAAESGLLQPAPQA